MENLFMNIFILAREPKICAQMHCDRHVVKMILEYAQLLSTAHQVLNGPRDDLYRATHTNHPCSIWVRQSAANYEFLYNLLVCLCTEYSFRYYKEHSVQSSGLLKRLGEPPKRIKELLFRFKDIPQCMPDDYKSPGNPIRAYRTYYNKDKWTFATWKRRADPKWFKPPTSSVC